MCLTLSNTYFVILATSKFSSANAFNLSPGNGLSLTSGVNADQTEISKNNVFSVAGIK